MSAQVIGFEKYRDTLRWNVQIKEVWKTKVTLNCAVMTQSTVSVVSDFIVADSCLSTSWGRAEERCLRRSWCQRGESSLATLSPAQTDASEGHDSQAGNRDCWSRRLSQTEHESQQRPWHLMDTHRGREAASSSFLFPLINILLFQMQGWRTKVLHLLCNRNCWEGCSENPLLLCPPVHRDFKHSLSGFLKNIINLIIKTS